MVYKLSDDPGMAAFAIFIRTNPSLPGLATIYRITGAHLEWTGLILEKLRPMTSIELASWSSWFVAEIIKTRCAPSPIRLDSQPPPAWHSSTLALRGSASIF